MRRLLLLLLLAALPARSDSAGEFDYYVLALSWSPSWCAAEGDARGADQCDPRHDHGFILHGLWPQYESGYPEYCRSSLRDPSRRQTGAMEDIMGSGGLAWHQWKKHGRCTGLDGPDYLALSREAYTRVTRPPILRKVAEELTLRPAVIEAAFLEANPEMMANGITVTCRDRRIQEVRICLSRDLTPRGCGADVIRDCSQPARLPPIR